MATNGKKMDKRENQIGYRLLQWIKSQGKSQKQFAEDSGINRVNLSRIINGERSIGPDVRERLQKAGADVDWILTGRKPISGAKGKMIARYFLPNIKAVVIDTEQSEDGINILIYEEAEEVVTPSVHVFEDEVEKVEDVIVVQPSKKDMLKAAATPILRRE